jgi:hypothetical protein
MTAFNMVRMRVKPGRDKEVLSSFGSDPEIKDKLKANGMRKLSVIKTGERSFCLIGECNDMNGIVASRPEMIKALDRQRDLLKAENRRASWEKRPC